MANPVVVDLPHNLGADEARRRIEGGIGKLKDHIPGGAAEVRSSWNGDRLNLSVRAMGQDVDTVIDILERHVHLELALPPMLAFFGKQIENLLRRQGADLLEDKTKR